MPSINLLHATKWTGAVFSILGSLTVLFGAILGLSSVIIGIGIGAVMGAVFIFIIGMILVASEEMVIRSNRDDKNRGDLYGKQKE